MPGYVAATWPMPGYCRLCRTGQGWRFPPGWHQRRGDNKKQSAVGQLVTAYRSLGTRWADLDPLKRLPRPEDRRTGASFYGFSDADLNQTFSVGSLKGLPETPNCGDILETLKQTYCGTIGVEYMYMTDYNEKRWLQERLESHSFASDLQLPSRKSAFLSV
jgi:2-oxoglutarate dehydrogenase E1 component